MDVLIQRLLGSPHLRVENWQCEEQCSLIQLQVASVQPTPACPQCHQPAVRLHSHYRRTLADLPWSGYSLQIQLGVRKFFCGNPTCRQRIFTERLPDVVEPWARRTRRLAQRLTAIGLALGGMAGARLSRHFGLEVSRDTLLRLIRRLPWPDTPTPSILGVDDWAYRKRHTYGTILVDLTRRRPVTLLADREAETLAQWLRAHPGVTVISRDRAKAYAEGARAGAPHAIQVADRFHLLQNLGEALDQLFSAHGAALNRVKTRMSHEPFVRADGTVAVPVPPTQPTLRAREWAEQRRTRRLTNYTRVWDLHRRGWSDRAIARQVGVGRMTVVRYLQAPVFPERKGRRDHGRSLLDPYKEYLLKRWNAGHQEVRPLFREIQRQGYGGSYATVARYARRVRQAQGLNSRPPLPRGKGPEVIEPRQPPLTPRRATWLVLRRPEQRDAGDDRLIRQLKDQHADLAVAIELAQEFAAIVRQPAAVDPLDGWLTRVAQSAVPALQRFAKGLLDDYPAVQAGLTLPWSNGAVEGQINRLKMLKRTMYGRASLDLLSRRFLLAA
jgi:transposase